MRVSGTLPTAPVGPAHPASISSLSRGPSLPSKPRITLVCPSNPREHGVPVLLSRKLLYAPARMGHGDEIGEPVGDRASGTPTSWAEVWRDMRTPTLPTPTPAPLLAPQGSRLRLCPQPEATPHAREEPGLEVAALLWPPHPASE